MAGLDEARARAVLADMQDRLARGPVAALGIPAGASPEDARAAFLQLTKQYHPVRFGRMATDIQKLANEVFLALRAAHDSVAKTQRRPAGSSASASQPLPLAAIAPLAAPGNHRGQALPARPASSERSLTPPPGIPIASIATRPAKPAANRPAAPAAPAASSPASRPPGTVRPPASAAPVTAQDEAAVIDLLQRQQWSQARSALHQLSARDPASKRIQALVCYARGREAQLDRRLDDARVELQDALDLDPDLQVAKTALTELFTRRK